MIRTSLGYFVLGFLMGALMIAAKALGRPWLTGLLTPVHGHILLVGWFAQFVMGIAYWLLPRRRTERSPLGYSSALAFAVYGLLNGGLVLRLVAEPLLVLYPAPGLLQALLFLSGPTQLAAGLIWAWQSWRRLRLAQPPRTP